MCYLLRIPVPIVRIPEGVQIVTGVLTIVAPIVPQFIFIGPPEIPIPIPTTHRFYIRAFTSRLGHRR
jgi:hypothetical protein